jgi:hypothetical protein
MYLLWLEGSHERLWVLYLAHRRLPSFIRWSRRWWRLPQRGRIGFRPLASENGRQCRHVFNPLKWVLTSSRRHLQRGRRRLPSTVWWQVGCLSNFVSRIISLIRPNVILESTSSPPAPEKCVNKEERDNQQKKGAGAHSNTGDRSERGDIRSDCCRLRQGGCWRC